MMMHGLANFKSKTSVLIEKNKNANLRQIIKSSACMLDREAQNKL